MKRFLKDFGNELLLNSGQFALFYILMNFSSSGAQYFQDTGHTVLLFILIIQTSLLVLFGRNPLPRFFLSLIAPGFYTLIEIPEGLAFVFNMGHMFFWFSSIITGLTQALLIKSENTRRQAPLEFLLTGTNVASFLIVYFYFDVQLTLDEKLTNSLINMDDYYSLLQINAFPSSFADFISDPAHIFVIIGGAILALGISIGRIRILQLSERIHALFGRYVDKNVRDRILARKEDTVSESREAAILFSDIRDFTTLSENSSPEEITEMLNEYFTWWDSEVERYGGIIDKYIGDAVMVIFGLDSVESACSQAVNCAISMYSSLEKLKARLKSQDLPVIQDIGIGINFGKVIIGDIGSKNRRNFTVIGDTVNVASRLETLTKKVQTPIVVSSYVMEQLDPADRELFIPRGEVLLKGRRGPTAVFSIIPGAIERETTMPD